MRHGQIVVGRRKVLRLLSSHHLAMSKKPEVGFGQAFRQLVILLHQRIGDHLDGFEVLHHHPSMLVLGWGREKNCRPRVRRTVLIHIATLNLGAPCEEDGAYRQNDRSAPGCILNKCQGRGDSHHVDRSFWLTFAQ